MNQYSEFEVLKALDLTQQKINRSINNIITNPDSREVMKDAIDIYKGAVEESLNIGGRMNKTLLTSHKPNAKIEVAQ